MVRKCSLLCLIFSLGAVVLLHSQNQVLGTLNFNLVKTGAASQWWYESSNPDRPLFAVDFDLSARMVRIFTVETSAKPIFWGRFNTLGNIEEFVSNQRHLITSTKDGKFKTDFNFDGKTARQALTNEIILDSNFSCFAVGLFALYKTGDEVSIRIAIPQEAKKGPETTDYEASFKVVGREVYKSKAGSFECLKVEFSFKGIIGAVAPRLTVWVDVTTRRTVAFRGQGTDNNSLPRELVRIGP